MNTDFSLIVKEALEVRCEAFCKLLEQATRLLCREEGEVGNLNIMGRLVRLKPCGEALIIGDLHGDLESLIDISKESHFMERLRESADTVLIFLGDYGDRGAYSAEIYYVVLKLKLLFPDQVVLMRGNHEGPEDLLPDPYDLPCQFQTRFGEKWNEAHRRIRKLFTCLYNAVLIKERYLLVHGGVPAQANTIENLAFAHILHPRKRLLEDMLWSDPSETDKKVEESPRGAGKRFGESVTENVLKKFGVKILIRGHEPCQDGFKIDHSGRVLTLFSAKGPPYFNDHGAYLDVRLSERLDNAEQLIPCIHKF